MSRAAILGDEQFMAEALALAARIPRPPWPNPPVGAVVVKDGRIVGRGAHHGAGTPHAEIVALAEAGSAASGATLYCTLEPCNHTGRTPPCAPAVVRSGVRRTVMAISDPNPTVAGGGLQLLRQSGIEVTLGVLAAQALEQIWPFVVTGAFARPYVLLKTATSLDGCFAPPLGQRGESSAPAPAPHPAPCYLTQDAARRDVHVIRRWMDLVLVGEGTLRSDRPRLDGRLLTGQEPCPAADPAVGYVDTDLSYDQGWDHARYLVFAGNESAGAGAHAAVTRDGGLVIRCDVSAGHVDPASLVARARERDVHCLMVEGGPHLAAAFLASGLVDRWVQYIAPLILGTGVRWPQGAAVAPSRAAQQFHLTRHDRLGPDVRLIFDRLSFDGVLTTVTAVAEVDRRVQRDDSDQVTAGRTGGLTQGR